MKTRTLTVLGIALLTMGCGVTINGPDHCDDDDDDVEVHTVTHPYINTYVKAPREVKDLIAPYVNGFFSPSTSRYCDYLYPHDVAYDPYDLPCFVRGDFNGDGYFDFSFLFSFQEWRGRCWYLTTKMIVVVTTPHGYTIAADIVLGTVSGGAGTPIEEYWSIFLVPAGTHSITYMDHGVTVTKTITLDDDGFYLASLDPKEEALFYVSGCSKVCEINWPDRALGKHLAAAAGDRQRIIPFNKNVEGRKRPIQ